MTLSNDNGMSLHDPDAVGEPDELHTGDDERIDLVSSIIATAEEIEGSEETTECAASIIADCHKLDALLLATIKRERLSPPPAAETPTDAESLLMAIDKKVQLIEMCANRREHPCASCDGQLARIREIIAALLANPSPAAETPTLTSTLRLYLQERLDTGLSAHLTPGEIRQILEPVPPPADETWKPIATAPHTDRVRVDLWCSSADGVDQWRETDCWWNANRKLWCNLQGQWDEATATHWMPLPSAPAKDTK